MNYALGKAYERIALLVPRAVESTRNTGGEGDVTHAVKGTFVYELPFGQGKRLRRRASAR